MAPVKTTAAGEVDTEAIRRRIDGAMPTWAAWQALEAKVEACHLEHVKRTARRNWVRAAIGGGIGTLLTAAAFAIRAILAASAAAGAAAEAGRAQAELLRGTATLARTLEVQQAAMQAQLSFLLARISGRRTPDPE